MISDFCETLGHFYAQISSGQIMQNLSQNPRIDLKTLEDIETLLSRFF